MKTPLPNLAVDVMASKTLAKDTHIVGVVVQKKGGGVGPWTLETIVLDPPVRKNRYKFFD